MEMTKCYWDGVNGDRRARIYKNKKGFHLSTYRRENGRWLNTTRGRTEFKNERVVTEYANKYLA